MSYIYRLGTGKPVETYEHAEYALGTLYAGYEYLKKHRNKEMYVIRGGKRKRVGPRRRRRLVLVSPPRTKRARPMMTPLRARTATGRRRAPGGKFSKSVIGRPIGTADCKTALVSGAIALSTRSLNFFNIIQIPQVQISAVTGPGSHPSISARERAVVDLRGLRFDIEYRNNIARPLQVNMAVVVPRQQANVATSDWFTDPNGTTERYVAFSTALSSLQFNTYGICSDHYTILKHKRFLLGGQNPYTSQQLQPGVTGKQAFCTKKIYMPIKRQVTFFNDDAVDADNPIFLVHWCDFPFTNAGTTATANAMLANYLVRLYFREPKN